MIEQYYIVLGCTLIALMLAWHQAAKWWRKRYPVRFRVGDTVTFGDGRSTYYVLDTKAGDHPMFPRVVCVDTRNYAGAAVWGADPRDLRLVVRGSGTPTEREARWLNEYYGISCDNPSHDIGDCSHKARQRVALLLPGHQ